jgi:hypothetical protein
MFAQPDPFSSVEMTYAGKRICFRRLLSNADAGTKRRSRLTWRAVLARAVDDPKLSDALREAALHHLTPTGS